MSREGKMVICITRDDGDTLEMTLTEGKDIEDWKDLFRTILSFMTFHPSTIEELWKEEE